MNYGDTTYGQIGKCCLVFWVIALLIGAGIALALIYGSWNDDKIFINWWGKYWLKHLNLKFIHLLSRLSKIVVYNLFIVILSKTSFKK